MKDREFLDEQQQPKIRIRNTVSTIAANNESHLKKFIGCLTAEGMRSILEQIKIDSELLLSRQGQ